MLATPSETLACPENGRRRRLAAQLADMIPGADTIRVTLNRPGHTWPHPHAVAKDGEGRTVEVGRTKGQVAARWILRAWPETDWTRPHTLNLRDATLVPGGPATTARGR